MNKFIPIGLSMSLLAAVAISAVATQPSNTGDGKPAAGPTEATYGLVFNSASDTHSFLVEKAQKAGDLTVDTLDCCIPGDHWKVTLTPLQPSNQDTSGTGTGDVDNYSGAATGSPWVRGIVTVSYDGGVDVFPAGMTVRFRYSQHSNNNTGMNITQQN